MTTNSSSGPKRPRPVPPPQGAAAPRGAAGYSRFIPREELGAFAAWAPHTLNGALDPAAPGEPGPAAAEPTALPAQVAAARQAGYQDGYRDGLVALDSFKQSFAAQLASQLGQLLKSLDAQLDALEPQMAQAVARCAVLLARQVVRAEIETRPEHVAEAAAQAVSAVLQSARQIRVLVHPEDLPLVAAGAGEALQARGAKLLAQPGIERGGCLVESDLGQVDARIAPRWQQAAQLLGSELPWADAPDGAEPAP